MPDVQEPIWTAENINRKEGDTTFKQCGWCKYRGTGSYRYGAMISGSCSLMRSYRNEVAWNTACKISPLGKEDLTDFISSKEYEIEQARESIRSTKEELGVLSSLLKKAEKRPPLPENRRRDWPLGETIWVMHEAKWNKGVIVGGYRSGDGCVSYVLDDYPESQGQPKGKGAWGCGWSVPCILLDWEYKYFLKHPDHYEEWLKGSDREYNGEPLRIEDYRKAMQKALKK